MTDITELVKQLREQTTILMETYRGVLKERDDVIEAQAKEIEELREALKETLAIAERNELGDYQLRARAKLKGEK